MALVQIKSAMMTNQLRAGVWVRFRQSGEIQGRGHGLAGSVILVPSQIDHKKRSKHFPLFRDRLPNAYGKARLA
jgi:hypothetical protein